MTNNNNAIVEFTAVASDVAAVTLVAAAGNRVVPQIHNNAATNALYAKWDGTPTSSSFSFKLVAGALYEMPLGYCTTDLNGIWGGDGAGEALVTEIRDN